MSPCACGPSNPFNDIDDEDPLATAVALCKAAEPMGLAYVHIMRSLAELDAFAWPSVIAATA